MEKIQVKVPGMDNSSTREAYKVLRTNLQFCGEDYRSVMLTSCVANEGKTAVTLGLGRCLAEQGKRVLVVDADLRKSMMAERNTTARQPKGLSELLTGQNPLSECVYHTDHPCMDVLFAGKFPPNPVELLGSKKFAALIGGCREHYDYILVDTPPLGAVIDAAVVASVCDGVILILADGKVRYSQVREAVSQLEKSGSRLLGVVRNQTEKTGRSFRRSK